MSMAVHMLESIVKVKTKKSNIFLISMVYMKVTNCNTTSQIIELFHFHFYIVHIS